MYKLNRSSVVQWVNTGADRRPVTFDTVCPSCGKQVNFQVIDTATDHQRSFNSSTADCSRCHDKVVVWSVEGGSELYMRPAPSARQPVDGAEMMSDPARRAYESAINVFNVGEWNATAVQTRVALEGMDQYQARAPLAQHLKKLAESKTEELAQPLLTLSDTLREGGNIGAHFDLMRTTDREMAQAMLDLMDYLIEYVYTLPQRIEDANGRIRELDPESPGAETA